MVKLSPRLQQAALKSSSWIDNVTADGTAHARDTHLTTGDRDAGDIVDGGDGGGVGLDTVGRHCGRCCRRDRKGCIVCL